MVERERTASEKKRGFKQPAHTIALGKVLGQHTDLEKMIEESPRDMELEDSKLENRTSPVTLVRAAIKSDLSIGEMSCASSSSTGATKFWRKI